LSCSIIDSVESICRDSKSKITYQVAITARAASLSSQASPVDVYNIDSDKASAHSQWMTNCLHAHRLYFSDLISLVEVSAYIN